MSACTHQGMSNNPRDKVHRWAQPIVLGAPVNSECIYCFQTGALALTIESRQLVVIILMNRGSWWLLYFRILCLAYERVWPSFLTRTASLCSNLIFLCGGCGSSQCGSSASSSCGGHASSQCGGRASSSCGDSASSQCGSSASSSCDGCASSSCGGRAI